MKIVYTMVWPVLIDIKWAPILLNFNENFLIYVMLLPSCSGVAEKYFVFSV